MFIKLYKKILLLIFFAINSFGLLIPISISAQTTVTAPTFPGNWSLAFSDEFNSSTLDLAKWEPSWWNGTKISPPVNVLEASCYDPAQVNVSGGNLNITAKTTTDPNCKIRSGAQASYASGMIDSRNSFVFNYGYMESRMYLPGNGSNIYNWPAFWSTTTGTWPLDGEIDVMESLSTHQPCWHYHYQDSSGVHQSPGGCITQTTPWGWHTYGALWEPGKITFYYDGQLAGTVTNSVSNAKNQYVIFTYGLNTAYGINVPATMMVDYVRVWQNSNITTPPQKPAACKGDYDLSGTLDIADFRVFAQNYKKSVINCSLDITGGDCLLNLLDLAEFAKLYKVQNACV